FTVRSFILPFRIYADCSRARYITTAHSSLCSETMSLRGRGEGGWLCFRCLRSPGPPRTPRRVGTLRKLNFKMRDTSPRWHGSVGHDALLPTRFPLCVVTSPGPSDRIRRVGALWGGVNGVKRAVKTSKKNENRTQKKEQRECKSQHTPQGPGPGGPPTTRGRAPPRIHTS